ncbi:MAG: hypothetical protein PHH55_09420, partial [Candidatus Delongbacteria bacterium]|nr:hypothetical protein [Candidatus Delongbacteria bacterium]
PIKVFTEFNPKYVWSNITMTTEANKIIIHVSEKAIFNYLEWFKKIQSLKDWLDVRIQIGERNIEIEFI